MIILTKKISLFVYGTLKDKSIFKLIIGHDATFKDSFLLGYRQTSKLKIKKGNKDDKVVGKLVENITKSDLETIDQYEVIGKLYNRKKLMINIGNGENKLAWVYVPIN